jgi:hypothetical protein
MRNIFVFALFILLSSVLYSQTVDEYTLKAIWIGKFTHFIDWPEKTNSENPYFYIGVFNQDSFQGKLDIIYSNYSLNNKPVKIKYINNIDSIKFVNLCFISENNEKNMAKILRIARENNVLLIGDSKGYAEQGVHINFYTIENQIRFEINESAMRESGFFVSYRLLNIAKIIHPIEKE